MINQILTELKPNIDKLNNHEIYKSINTMDDLRFFMTRHSFAVFDFMSLTKAVQHVFAPINALWTPPKNRELARFINEIILAEETDLTPDGQSMSHFELYLEAMNEVKANSDLIFKFSKNVTLSNLAQLGAELSVPKSSLNFMNHTFNTIKNGKIHEIAACFCLGREKIIPKMFESLIQKMNIKEKDAPLFHYYLARHIEIDGDEHGPMAVKMLEILCEEDDKKWTEVKMAAKMSIEARILFWDEILSELNFELIKSS